MGVVDRYNYLEERLPFLRFFCIVKSQCCGELQQTAMAEANGIVRYGHGLFVVTSN